MTRFSRRLAWDTPANPLALLLDERRRQRAPLIDLTESNPTRVDIEYPAGELCAALADPRATLYEPTPHGLPHARRAVADYYKERAKVPWAPGFDVDPRRIVLTASTSEGYAWLFKLLADPGDAVLVPRPSYPLFDYLAALEGVRLVQYPLV